MSSETLKTYYLDTVNQNKLRNYVLTQLSKEYNIQPVVNEINSKFPKIMSYIADNIVENKNLPIQKNLDYLNRVTIERCLSGFANILEPYKLSINPLPPKHDPLPPKATPVEKDNGDVTNMYSKLMSERDYSNIPISNLSTPVAKLQIDGQPPQFAETDGILPLPTVPEEPEQQIIPNYGVRQLAFKDRIEQMKQGRVNLQDQRNQVDLETRDQNFRQNYMGEQPKPTVNYNNDLQDNKALHLDNQNLKNIGKNLMNDKEIDDYRYSEYKGTKQMDFRNIDRQLFLNSKDRIWYGEVKNNIVQPGLEPYRYRFQMNNQREKGIYLQNRHKNITSIRIVAVYISIVEVETALSPYIFVYVPELDNRLETSLSNRKYVLAVLTKDDRIGNQVKYINFLTSNIYYPSPLAELPTMTFEILNPLGYVYNDSKDDLKIIEIAVDDLDNPNNIIFTSNKYFKSKQYITGDVLLVKNFAFINGSNTRITSYINRDQGNLITTPESLIINNEYLNKVYISLPKTILDDGTQVLDPMSIELVNFLKANSNPYSEVYGQFINLNLQPSIIMEISKIEPNSKEINVSRVTII